MPITLTKWKAYFARRGREAEKLFNSEMDLIKTASQTVIDTLSDAFIIKDNLEEPMKIGQKSMNIEEKAALLRMVIALGEKLGCTHKNWDDDRSDEDD
nr:SP13.7 [Bemisia tabaci]